jgi:cell wall assembly regulator SMI1
MSESHPDPALLTESLLEELERAIEPHAPGFWDSLPAGLASEQIDELTEPLGLRLPIEVRTLWTSHDGYAHIIFGWTHPPLILQVERYRRCRTMAKDRAKDLGFDAPELGDPELWWPAELVPDRRTRRH